MNRNFLITLYNYISTSHCQFSRLKHNIDINSDIQIIGIISFSRKLKVSNTVSNKYSSFFKLSLSKDLTKKKIKQKQIFIGYLIHVTVSYSYLQVSREVRLIFELVNNKKTSNKKNIIIYILISFFSTNSYYLNLHLFVSYVFMYFYLQSFI